jgi:WD40 repeat protein
MTAIRHLAASRDGSVLAAAEFESTVHLWDLETLAPLRTFETTLDFGGSRLAVSPDGGLIVVGSYESDGIAAYRSSDGSEMWRRKDLKKVQQLRFSHDGRLVCCFDGSPCERLDPMSGKSGKALRGVRKFWASDIGSQCLLVHARDYVLADAKTNLAIIPKASFAVLSAAFSPSEICISEAGGSVRCFSLKSGAMLWRFDPPEGTHFLRLAYQESSDQFVGISWPFQNGGCYKLCRFDRDSGEARPQAEISSAYACAFWRNGSRLITASGAVIDLTSGHVEATLAFPQKPPKITNT